MNSVELTGVTRLVLLAWCGLIVFSLIFKSASPPSLSTCDTPVQVFKPNHTHLGKLVFHPRCQAKSHASRRGSLHYGDPKFGDLKRREWVQGKARGSAITAMLR